MQIDDHIETSRLSPVNGLVEEFQLSIDVRLSVIWRNSPVTNGNSDVSQSRSSYLVEVILADKAAPMLRQSVPCLGLAQDVRQCPLVDSTVSHFIKERRGDPWLYHKPTAKVNTANFVAVVVKVSGTRFKVTGEHKLAISDSKLWDTLGQLTMLAKV